MRVTPFDDRLAAVERVFGAWLDEDDGHKLQIAWDRVHRELDSRFQRRGHGDRSPIDLRKLDALTFIEKVANAVVRVHDALGFRDIILPKLLSPPEFGSALHECEVATWFAKDGLRVEFVPTDSKNGVKTPDLRVYGQGGAIEVECKQKEPITVSKMTQHTGEWLLQQFGSVLQKLNLNVELTGLLIGPATEDSLAAGITRIESLATADFRGYSLEADIPMSVVIKNSPSEIPNGTIQEYEAWAASRGCVVSFCDKSPFGNGTYRFANHRGIGVEAIPGHSFNQVDDSIKTASKQLSPLKLGIVFINVNIAPASSVNFTQDVYLQILVNALSHRIWGGQRNRRIGTVVLKLSCGTEEVTCGPCTYNTNINKYVSIFRPEFERPNDDSPSNIINFLLGA
jgi:hypothetical protein